MGFNKKPPPADDTSGAPEWMVTFSDCLTLLLTFFVLLMTFSSIGVETIPGLSNAFRRVMPGFKWADQMYRNNLATIMKRDPVEGALEGSEHATLEQGPGGWLKETTGFRDPYAPRVFLIPSSKIFAGRAATLSPQGREILDVLAAYLNKVPNGVIIGEHRAARSPADDQIGPSRMLAVVDYLTTKGGLERSRFGISTASVAASGAFSTSRQDSASRTDENTIEIVLLGENVSK